MEKGQGERIPGTGKGPDQRAQPVWKEYEVTGDDVLECKLSKVVCDLLVQVLGCHRWTCDFCSGQGDRGEMAGQRPGAAEQGSRVGPGVSLP